jgi:heme-degrading monooxygenase HmoA
MLKPLKAVFVAIALVFSLMSVAPTSAAAATTVSFEPSSSIVNASTIYETTEANQDAILTDVLKSAEALLPASKGFVDATVLKGQDGAKVVMLSQWQDLPSYQAYETKRRADATETHLAELVNVRSYGYGNIYHQETRKGLPTIHEGDINVMFSEYLLRDPAKQSELLGVTAQFMPNVMKIKSGLQWVTLLPSVDQTTTAFVARFDKPEDFETLSQDSGFTEYAYWDPYAENDHHLYDVVKIIS